MVKNLSFNPVIVRQFFQQLEAKHRLGQFEKKKDRLADAEDGYKRNFQSGGGGGFIFTNVRLADETLLKK